MGVRENKVLRQGRPVGLPYVRFILSGGETQVGGVFTIFVEV